MITLKDFFTHAVFAPDLFFDDSWYIQVQKLLQTTMFLVVVNYQIHDAAVVYHKLDQPSFIVDKQRSLITDDGYMYNDKADIQD